MAQRVRQIVTLSQKILWERSENTSFVIDLIVRPRCTVNVKVHLSTETPTSQFFSSGSTIGSARVILITSKIVHVATLHHYDAAAKLFQKTFVGFWR